MVEERIREEPSDEAEFAIPADKLLEEWEKAHPFDPSEVLCRATGKEAITAPAVATESDLKELKSRLKDYIISQTRMNDLHD